MIRAVQMGVTAYRLVVRRVREVDNSLCERLRQAGLLLPPVLRAPPRAQPKEGRKCFTRFSTCLTNWSHRNMLKFGA